MKTTYKMDLLAVALAAALPITSAYAQEKTPGFNTKIPEKIMTPDKADTHFGPLNFVDGGRRRVKVVSQPPSETQPRSGKHPRAGRDGRCAGWAGAALGKDAVPWGMDAISRERMTEPERPAPGIESIGARRPDSLSAGVIPHQTILRRGFGVSG